MRALQFWILLLGSVVISVLLIKEIFLNRSLYQKERDLADSQEIAATGPGYQNAWKQVAVRVFQIGHGDPALTAALKSESIVIHTNPGAESGTNSETTPAPPTLPPASSKTPASAAHSTP
jgi:hypothetical protein